MQALPDFMWNSIHRRDTGREKDRRPPFDQAQD